MTLPLSKFDNKTRELDGLLRLRQRLAERPPADPVGPIWSQAAAPPAPPVPPVRTMRDDAPAAASSSPPLDLAPDLRPRTVPVSDDVLHVRCPEAELPIEVEQRLLTAITRPIDPGESHHEGNARREREIVALFATLSPAQALRLGQRIDAARSDDPIANAMKRLVSERRVRLRTALQNHRRTAAHAALLARR